MFEKIEDYKITYNLKEDICRSREHQPPGMIVLQPGRYIWTCPSCGKKTEVSVPLITY